MKSIIVLALVLNLQGVFSVFLAPGILEQKPANRTICFTGRVDGVTPYIECGTGSSIRIVSAMQQPSSRIEQCLEQTLNNGNNIPAPLNACRRPIDNNATNILQSVCNFREACIFPFSSFAPNNLRCLNGNNLVTVQNFNTNVQVVYFCDNPRRKFRPFSNKRFDPKFSASLFRQVRHPSNNRFIPVK